MTAPSLSQPKLSANRLAGWLVAIVAGLALLILLFAVWLLTLDMRGTYHLSTPTATWTP